MKNLLLPAILIINAFCANCIATECRPYVLCDAIHAKINKSFAKEGMYTWGFGGGFPDTLRSISNCYVTKKFQFTSPENANPFICKLMSDFIAPFNAEKKLRPFMHDYPFTSKNIDLAIIFLDKKGKPLEPPYLHTVYMNHGVISYFTYDKLLCENVFVKKDTFERINRLYGNN